MLGEILDTSFVWYGSEKDPDIVKNKMQVIWETCKSTGKEVEPFFLTERFSKMRDSHKLLFIALTNYWRDHKYLVPKNVFKNAVKYYLGTKAIHKKVHDLKSHNAIARIGNYYVFSFVPSKWDPPFRYRRLWNIVQSMVERVVYDIANTQIQSYPELKKWLVSKYHVSPKTIRNIILLLVNEGVMTPKTDGLHVNLI